MAGTALLATAVSGGAQVASSIDQRKAAKRAERRQRRANEIERARSAATQSLNRRRAISQARQAQAINTAAGLSQGITQGSSSIQGAQGSLFSNLGTSLQEANRSFVSGQQSFDLRQRAAFGLNRAQENSALINTATNAFNTFGRPFLPTGG